MARFGRAGRLGAQAAAYQAQPLAKTAKAPCGPQRHQVNGGPWRRYLRGR